MHASPPGLTVSGGAPQPAQPLFLIPAHLELFDVYDVQACGWRHMQSFFMKLDWKGGKEVDITMGEHYHWWLVLANSDTTRTAIKTGVRKIVVGGHAGHPCIFVTIFRISGKSAACIEQDV